MLTSVVTLGAVALCATLRSANGASLGSKSAVAAMPFVAYMEEEAYWRKDEYKFSARDLVPILGAIDAVVYKSLKIDESTFNAFSSSENAAQEYEILNTYKATGHEDLKVLFSVGGEYTASGTWSTMASTETFRMAFINSIKTLMDQYKFDGVELDWNFPCSPPKKMYIPFDADTFREVDDAGGMEEDHANLALLLQELRTVVGQDKLITMTLPYNASNISTAIPLIEPLVDVFMVKGYGYSESSNTVTGGSSVTAPLQPLQNPNIDGISTGSVEDTISDYVKAGVSSQKMNLVMPTYGSTYYTPEIARDGWEEHGVIAKISGACYGPYKETYGAFPDDAAHRCGQIGYHEMAALLASGGGPEPIQDATSKAGIAFLPSKETFVSFTGPATIASIANYAQSSRLGGVSLGGIENDGYQSEKKLHTFVLTLATCRAMFGDSAGRCQLANTTTAQPPVAGDCSGRDHGTYCLDDYTFMYCPEQLTSECAPGTVCKQENTSSIICDWPSKAEV